MSEYAGSEKDKGDFHFRRGNSYSNLGEYQKAIRDFDTVIGLCTSNPYAYNNRGMAHLCSGNNKEALQDLNKAIFLKSNYADAYHNRALVYFETN